MIPSTKTTLTDKSTLNRRIPTLLWHEAATTLVAAGGHDIAI